MKTCTRCKQEKRFREFCSNRATADGMSKWCRACTKEYRQSKRVKKPPRVLVPESKVCVIWDKNKPILYFIRIYDLVCRQCVIDHARNAACIS